MPEKILGSIPTFDKTWSGTPAFVIACVAVVVTFVCFSPSLRNGWVNWDDEAYVLENPLIQDLTSLNIRQMFTTEQVLGLYHPLTLLSFAIDYEWWKTDAFGYHLSNLLLHLANVILVFYLILKISRKKITALVTALLFGMHPMHVESVAWISGRKDLLYALFFLVSLLAYLKYISSRHERKWLFYTFSLLAFCLSLLSKGMAFILPFILLLLDHLQYRQWTRKSILEKVPFFLLSIIFLVIAKAGQQASDSMMSLNEYPLHQTAFIGSHNVLIYLYKAILPHKLAAFHPFPFLGKIELPVYFYFTALPVAGLLYILFRIRNSQRMVFFGLAFFLISLGPVLQIFPYGKALFAERYTYVAYIGLFFILGEWIHKIWKKEKADGLTISKAILLVPLAWIVFLGIISRQQVEVWKNGESLWSQVISNYPEHYFGYFSRARYRKATQKFEIAMNDFDQAASFNPENPDILFERGELFERTGRPEAALQDYTAAIAVDQQAYKAFHNRALLRVRLFQDYTGAKTDLETATEIRPDYALAYANLGMVCQMEGDYASALDHYNNAIELEPGNFLFYRMRGVLAYRVTDYQLAKADFEILMQIQPENGEPYYLRSEVYRALGNDSLAWQDAMQAVSLGHILPEAYLDSLKFRD